MPFNLGFGELALIAVIFLLVFGAKRLPEIGGAMGKGIREFKKNISDVDRQIREPESERPADRLGAGDPTASTRAADEETRPEPKRLMH